MKANVLTGDIAGFTTIPPDKRVIIIKDLKKILNSWVAQPGYAEIFRGDSFQLLFKDIAEALKRAIQLRCWLKSQHAKKNKTLLDAKIAIGIGDIAYFSERILDADGEAFHLSGRTFDVMKAPGLKIMTADETLNKQLDIILSLLDAIISTLTTGQAEVLFMLMENKTQTDIATELNIAQSAVNNRIKLAQWKNIDKTLQYLTSLLSNKDL
ncbi:MAG: helix-turn-helix transcriptional regulator [Sphingobacteriaceae bacterium]